MWWNLQNTEEVVLNGKCSIYHNQIIIMALLIFACINSICGKVQLVNISMQHAFEEWKIFVFLKDCTFFTNFSFCYYLQYNYEPKNMTRNFSYHYLSVLLFHKETHQNHILWLLFERRLKLYIISIFYFLSLFHYFCICSKTFNIMKRFGDFR